MRLNRRLLDPRPASWARVGRLLFGRPCSRRRRPEVNTFPPQRGLSACRGCLPRIVCSSRLVLTGVRGTVLISGRAEFEVPGSIPFGGGALSFAIALAAGTVVRTGVFDADVDTEICFHRLGVWLLPTWLPWSLTGGKMPGRFRSCILEALPFPRSRCGRRNCSGGLLPAWACRLLPGRHVLGPLPVSGCCGRGGIPY